MNVPDPQALRAARIARGWTQAGLAVRLQGVILQKTGRSSAVDEKAIGRWESGARRPGPHYAPHLCELLGLQEEHPGAETPPRPSESEAATSTQDVVDLENQVTTALWAGDYASAAVRSHMMLTSAKRDGDHDIAALALSNLLLASRSGHRVELFHRHLRMHMRSVQWSATSPKFRYRLLKELFVFYYEQSDFQRAHHLLTLMESIDPELHIFTPADDWLPGTIRWRKAHLSYVLQPTPRTLRSAVSIAQEGVDYLDGRRNDNPNRAGMASAVLNLGWLRYLGDDPICLDYFALAQTYADGWSQRTVIESLQAAELAGAKFGYEPSADRLHLLATQLRDRGHANRTYEFLRTDTNWSQLKTMITRPRAYPGT